jgi:hypothetical protein
MSRAKSIQIYLKEGIEQDDLLLALWSVLRQKGRPQEAYRRMLLLGYEAMRASGEFSDSILEGVEDALSGEVPEIPAKRSPPRKMPEKRSAPPEKKDEVDPAPSGGRVREEPATEGRSEARDTRASGQPAAAKQGGAAEASGKPPPKAPFTIGDLM